MSCICKNPKPDQVKGAIKRFINSLVCDNCYYVFVFDPVTYDDNNMCEESIVKRNVVTAYK